MADSSTGDLLITVARALRRAYGEALRDWEITPGQARALRVVQGLDGARLSVLADRLRIAPRSATEVVDALEARGLVARGSDPSDRRATTVSITVDGEDLLAVIERARRQVADSYLAVLPADDRRQLDRILTMLAGRE